MYGLIFIFCIKSMKLTDSLARSLDYLKLNFAHSIIETTGFRFWGGDWLL